MQQTLKFAKQGFAAVEELRPRGGHGPCAVWKRWAGLSCACLPSQVYMYQLFRSLAYIHSQGVCHRDIKPQNLLVDPDTAVLKLCDFGR